MTSPKYHPKNKENLDLWYSYRNQGSVATSGTVRDYSGNSFNGTATGGAFVDNSGINLDGVDSYIYIGSQSSLASNTQTISFVLTDKGASKTGFSYIFARSRDADEYASLGLVYTSIGNLTLSTNSGGSSFELDTLINWSALSNGDALTLVLNYPSAIFYLNGEQYSSFTRTQNFNLNPSFANAIGRAGDYDGYYTDAIIDDFMIINRALSANEVKINYLINKRG